MLARPHSSGGSQSGSFQTMANRQYLNPPSSTFSHSTGLAPVPAMHSSPNHSLSHAPTFSDPLSGGHYTFGSAGASTASGSASANPNPESSFNHPSMQSGDHDRESYVYSNVQGNLGPYFGGLPGNLPSSNSTSYHDFAHHSSSSLPTHHHHPHHFSSGSGSTYSMLGGVPVGHSGGHQYLGGSMQYEGYPAFYNPFEVKHRRRTTRTQFKVLESTFLETPKPTASTRKALAEQLDMPLRAIQIWFQNRRAKAKSQSHRSSTSHNLPGGSGSSTSGKFADSPPSITSHRAGSGSGGIGRPSTSSSGSSFYPGSKSGVITAGPSGDSKPPLSSSSLSSTGSGQAQAFPFEESKRYTYPNSGPAKPVHLSRLDLPPLTSGEPSSGSSSFAPPSLNPSYDSFKIPSGKPSQRGSITSSSVQQQSYSHSSYNPSSNYSGIHSHNSPILPSNPSGDPSNTNDNPVEQNKRSHQSSSWR